LQEPEISKYISRNSPFSGIWENIIHQEEDDLPEDTRALVREYLFPKLKKAFFIDCRQGVDISSCKRKNISYIESSTDQYFV
jgi:hypothetical protein